MLLLTFTSLNITGCGGEAEYSFEELQRLSGNFINGKIEFVSKDRIYVATANSDVITVKTNSTENVTFSIVGGVDSALFKIDSVTGKLTFIEKQPVGTYEVLVATEDVAGNRAIQIIDVEVVTDIKVVPPVINTTLTTYSVLNFEAVVFRIDADAADIQSSLSYSVSGTDSVYFTVDTKGDIRFTEGAETSTKTEFDLDVIVTDGYGNSSTLSAVSVTKVASTSDIKPIILTQNFKIVENSLGNAHIDVYKAPDATISGFTLSGGDAGMFTVSSDAKLHLKTAQDFEGVNGVFSFNLQVTDSNAQQSVLTPVTVEIKDIDETFHFNGIHDISVEEGHTGEVVTIDAAANTITDGVEKVFSLEQGGADFTIDINGVISFKSPAQIDTNITVQVSVESQFNGSKTLSEPFSVVVVDDPSKIAPTIDNDYPREITAVETQEILLSVQATLGGDATLLSYTLSGTDAASFSIDNSSGNISSNVAFNEAGSNVYMFLVEITDDNGNVVSSDTITVTLLQDPDEIRPVIGSTTFNILENSTERMSITVSSEGNGVVNTYTVMGADGVLFTFDVNGLRFKSAADFELEGSSAGSNVYNVTLQVGDDLGNVSDAKEIVVNVIDVDETLQFTSLSSMTVVEDTTEVGVIHANGKDETPVTITYTLLDHTADFTLDTVSGALALKSQGVLNSHYDVSIQAQSQFNGSVTQTVVGVDVVAKDYAITFAPQPVASLDQNLVVPVQIEATSAAGETLTYAMAVGTDASIFTINPTTGVMTVSVPAYIYSNDPEANIYRGAVVASDDLGHSATQQGELHVNAVDGLPQFVTPEVIYVDENEKSIVQIDAHSPIGSTLEYDIEYGPDWIDFAITPDGLLTFDYAKNFEYAEDGNADNIYEVDIRVTDTLHSVNSTLKRFLVQVNDVADGPTNIVFDATGTVSAAVSDGSIFFDTTTNLQLNATPSPSGGILTSTIVTNPDSDIFYMYSNGILRVEAPRVSSDTAYDIVIDVSEDRGETTRVTMHVTILE